MAPEVGCAHQQRGRGELQGVAEGGVVSSRQKVEGTGHERSCQLTDGEGRGHQTE